MGRKRAGAFETLLALAREVAAITTLSELRDAIEGPLGELLPTRNISILRAAHGVWEAIVGPADAPDRLDTYAWTPLVTDGRTIGMLGLAVGEHDAADGPLAEGATALLAMCAQSLIAFENLRLESVRDGLTGCFTRTHAMDVLEGNLRRANRTGLPVSVLMIDVDDFKRVNDRFGHMPGDAVLAAIGRTLHAMLRQSDVRCRLGGDEFLVILPDTAIEDGVRVAEAVRQAIADLAVPTARGPIRVTASIGVAADVCADPVDAATFIDRADVALYRAKQSGRNSVQICASSRERLRRAARKHRAAAPAGAPAPLRLAASRSA